MKEEKITEALQVALNFVQVAEDFQGNPKKHWQKSGTKLSGSLRRASMELTRALAEMRKP